MRIEDLSSRPRPHTIARSANLFPRLELMASTVDGVVNSGAVQRRPPVVTLDGAAHSFSVGGGLKRGLDGVVDARSTKRGVAAPILGLLGVDKRRSLSCSPIFFRRLVKNDDDGDKNDGENDDDEDEKTNRKRKSERMPKIKFFLVEEKKENAESFEEEPTKSGKRITSDFFKDGLVRPRSPLKTTKSVSNMSANSSSLDDGTSPEGGKQRQKVEEWRKKIEILKREIDNEQRQKDANVNEFLQMSQKADKSQISILKNIFEKRNLSHSVKIQKAQTNIEKYLRKIEEAESNVGRSFFYSPATSLVGSPVKKVDRDSDAQSKLKTFVSDDNLSAASDANSGSGAADAEPASDVVTGGSYGGGGSSSVGGGGGSNSNSLGGRGKAEPQDFSFVNGATTTTTPGTAAQEAWLLNELCASVNRARSDVMEMREAHERQMQDMLRQQQKARKDLEELRLHYDDEMKSAEYRYQRLEDQLNDQIDLQHTELLNLKQELIVLAKKEEVQIVDYRSEERSRDLHEKLEACEHKVEKMEKNQQDIYMPNPDNLQGFVYPKLINVVLCLIQLAILLINTVYNLATPFILTKPRLIMTIILATTMMVLHWNYDLVAVLILRIFDSNHSLIKSFQ